MIPERVNERNGLDEVLVSFMALELRRFDRLSPVVGPYLPWVDEAFRRANSQPADFDAQDSRLPAVVVNYADVLIVPWSDKSVLGTVQEKTIVLATITARAILSNNRHDLVENAYMRSRRDDTVRHHHFADLSMSEILSKKDRRA